MSDGGKGSSPRPYSVSYEDFSNSWDKIFGPKNIFGERKWQKEERRKRNDKEILIGRSI